MLQILSNVANSQIYRQTAVKFYEVEISATSWQINPVSKVLEAFNKIKGVQQKLDRVSKLCWHILFSKSIIPVALPQHSKI